MAETSVRLKAWKSLVGGVNIILGAICGSIMILMLVLTCVNVAMRYIFDNPIAWADQFTSYGLVYLTFIGAPYVLSKHGHVSMDLFPPKRGSILKNRSIVVINVAGIIYCSMFFLLSVRELRKVIAKKSMVLDAIAVPEWIVILVIPIGFALLIVQFVDNMLAVKQDTSE